MTKGTEYFRYRRQALDAPKANSATRVTLVASELGLSEEELEGFFYVNREGAKKRHFDYHAFAKKYGVATDIRRFPVGASPQLKTKATTPSNEQ